jgi:hypothetical protein
MLADIGTRPASAPGFSESRAARYRPRMRNRLSVAVLSCAVPLALGGCASAPGPRCTPGAEPMVDEQLFFGTQRPRGGGVVSDAEWADFVDHTIAPALPAGFSTWPVEGSWRDPSGQVVRETTHVLSVAHPRDDASDAAIAAIAAAYIQRFDQDAVLRKRTPACVEFQAPATP